MVLQPFAGWLRVGVAGALLLCGGLVAPALSQVAVAQAAKGAGTSRSAEELAARRAAAQQAAAEKAAASQAYKSSGKRIKGSADAVPTQLAPGMVPALAPALPPALPPGTKLPSGLVVYPPSPDARAAAPGAVGPSSAASPAAPADAAAGAPTTAAAEASQEGSYTRLAHPAVAERLKLSDEQRLKVAALLSERAEALAKAAPEDRAKQSAESEKKLAELLTEEQRTAFAQRPAEPKLRFNFRYQRWIDVLDWFSRQADLSLVLDAPPPGTFNYSDEREYTPTEAIDLLNGVLLTKGYTLVRHERMLIVVNLAEGIPEGLVPRIALADLDKRGRFELVSVLFPLSGRTPNDVIAEIKPLLGVHSKVVPLPATGQILVTDTAGVMRAVDAVIQSMPLLGRGGIPISNEPPQFAVYPVRTADAQATVEMLRAMVPGAMLILDPKTGNIHVLAGPTQQAVVKAAIQEMEAASPAEQQPRLEVYSIADASATSTQLVTSLQPFVPRAKLTVDVKAGKLIAWATPAEQQILSDAITKFGGGNAPENQRQMVAYPINTADPASVLRVLTTMFPNAHFVLESRTRRIIARALPTEQEAIQQAIAKIDTGPPGEGQESFMTYNVSEVDPKTVIRVLQDQFPEMRLAIDVKAGTILAWGRKADHEALAQTIKLMQAGPDPEHRPSVVTYPTGDGDPLVIATTLKALVPTARVSADAKSASLVAWGAPRDQETIRMVVAQMSKKGPPDTAFTLVVYTLESAGGLAGTPAAPAPSAKKGAAAAKGAKGAAGAKPAPAAAGAIPMLKTMFPNAQFAVGAEPDRLVAWARPADHVAIKKAVEEMSKRESPETAPRMMVYTLENTTATAALPILHTIFSDVQFAVGTDPIQIVAFARPAEHEELRKALTQLSEKEPAESARQIVVYTLDSSTAASAIVTLRPMFPGAQFSVGTEPSKLVAWARTADQAAIKVALAEIGKKEPPEIARTVIVYTVDLASAGAGGGGKASAKATAASVGGAAGLIPVLTKMFPLAQFTVGADPRRLIAWARPADHEAIKKAIDEVAKREPAETAPKMVVYTLENATSAVAMTVLRPMFPDAQFSPGTDPNKLIAYARPADQAGIKDAVALISEQEPPQTARKVVVYSMDVAAGAAAGKAGKGAVTGGAAVAIPVLQKMFPDAQFTAGSDPRRLVAYARPADQEKIKAAIEELSKPEPAETAPKVVVYTLENATSAVAMTVLRPMFPDAQFSPGTDPNKLIAYARPSDQAGIKAAVALISEQEPPQTARKVVVYTMDVASGAATGKAGKGAVTGGAAVAIPVLQKMFPDAQFTAGSDPRRLVAYARPADQEKIKAAIEELSKPEPAATAPRVVTYTLDSNTAAAALPILKTMFPDAQFGAGADPSQVIAFARPADQDAIKLAIGEMSRKDPPESARTVVVYTVDIAGTAAASGKGAARTTSGGAALVLPVLKAMFPNAQFTTGADPRRLITWARPAEQAEIKKAVEAMSQPEPAGTAPRVVTYTLDSNTAAAALPILKTMFPDAQFGAGADPSQVIAFARPADQDAIKLAIGEMSRKDPPESARTVVVYTVDIAGTAAASGKGAARTTSGGAALVLPVLKAMFPNAQFTTGADPRRLITWARPAEQAEIKKAVEAMSEPEPAGTAPRVVTYTLESNTAAAALPILKTMFPDAQFGAGADPSQIIAFARPADHEGINAAVTQMSKQEPPETAPRLVVYTVGLGAGPAGKAGSKAAASTGGAAGVIATLKTMFPNAQFSVGTDPSRLAAWARPADQEKIKTAVAELSKPEPSETARRVVVYTLQGATSTVALPVLTAMFPDAQFSAGADPSQVIAFARPVDQEAIQAAVARISEQEPPETARRVAVYTVDIPAAAVSGKTATAKAASGGGAALAIPLLQTMFPNAQFSVGSDPRRLVAFARPADQQGIQKAVDEMSKREPAATAPRVATYTLDTTSALNALPILKTMFPDAQFAAGNDPSQVIAFARPSDQEAIRAAVAGMSQKEPAESAPRIVVYTVGLSGGSSGKSSSSSSKSSGAAALVTPLKLIFPNAQFAVGADASKLVVYARPADHKAIGAAIDDMSKPEPAETAPKAVLYTVETITAVAAVPALQAMFPNAQFAAGTDPDTVIAWARPADHEVIKAAVAEMSRKDPPQTARKVVVYTIETSGGASSGTTSSRSSAANSGGAAAAATALKTMFPDAQFAVGADPSRLVVWARPSDHEQIQKAVSEMSKREPPETARRAEVYALEAVTADAAIALLKGAFPDAQLAAGADAGKLIVWARPADQALLKQAVEQIEAAGLPGTNRVLSIYPMKQADATSLAQVLDPMLKKNVTLIPDATHNRVLIWADPKHQEALKGIIEQYSKEVGKLQDPTSVVYRLRVADPKAAQTALTALAPSAQIALDTSGRTLIVTAMPEDHARIKGTVDELNREDAGGQEPVLRVHAVVSSDATALLKVLTALYKSRPDVQLSADDKNNAIVAVAAPAQHDAIQALIDQADKGALAEAGTKLQLFPLHNADPTAVLSVLTTLFAKQGAKVQLSTEPRTNQLVAFARPDQLEIIRSTVEQMRGDEQIMDIIQLEANDVTVAQQAIDQLFIENGVLHGPTAPQVQADTVGQQLFVQATKQQMPKIRDLLVKMGETSLAETHEGNTKFSRVVPFTGDPAAALEEIRKVWPQIRGNPIQVLPAVKPGGAAPATKPEAKPDASGPVPAAQPAGEQPAAKAAPPASSEPVKATPTPSPDPAAKPPEVAKPEVKPEVVKPEVKADKEGVPGAPIVVTPGDGSVTITSDDPAALDQFETLLRTMAQRGGAAGRDLTVYALKNARATAVATTLGQIYKSTPTGRRTGSAAGTLIAIPDERLNSLIVHANRADKTTIDNLVRMLDSGEVPEALGADRMKLIPVHNTSAAKIQEILLNLYKNQVDAFGVEENSNSLVITAPTALADEIGRLVQVLDDAAGGDPSRRIKLIPLHSNNSQRIQQALGGILGTGTRPKTSSSSTTRSGTSSTTTTRPSSTLSTTRPKTGT